jgi:lipopolysaccharide/colanic/teichoic acid biosynthesis glycosyltransferase
MTSALFMIAQFIAKAFYRLILTLLLLASLPLMVIIYLAILIDDGRPAFFLQERVGLNGKKFDLCKFRTMFVNSEIKSIDDWMVTQPPQEEIKRITFTGKILRKYRLDELPQLLNVALGDISIIGPRPERPEAYSARSKLIKDYDLRLTVTPGITGWAQVHAPHINALEKYEYDKEYIMKQSILFDTKIIYLTLRAIISGNGK